LFALDLMPLKSSLATLAALIAVAALTLLARPYEGLRHDGILYLGQVLINSRVPALSHDTFFVGGSQDRYSIYSHLLAPLYEHVGLMPTHVVVLLTSWLLGLGGVLRLLRRLEPAGMQPFWGLLAFAVMSASYGGLWIFSYSEPFVTGRSFAEPALLWSLVALLAGRWRTMAALQVLAALFHPLMALPVMAMSWCYLARTDRRWWWLLTGLPLALLASIAGIPPWNGMLKTYDPYWWALVEANNSQVLITQWKLRDQLTIALDMAVLLAVTRLRPIDNITRLIRAVVLITAAFIGLTALCADGLHNVLFTQLQLWRAHWVAHLLAVALAPWLLVRLSQLGGFWPVSASALALAQLDAHFGTGHGLATMCLWALTSLVSWRVRDVSRATVRLACGATLLCILGLSGQNLYSQLHQLGWKSPLTLWGDGFFLLATSPVVAASGFAALLLIAHRSLVGAIISTGLSVALLCVTALHWDQRQDLTRAVESAPTAEHPFSAHIPINATVYWPAQLLPVWALLERISHYAPQQGAGLLFNRDTGLMFGPRKAAYRLIDDERKRCIAGATLSRSQSNWLQCEVPRNDHLTSLCAELDAPDFLVLRNQLAGINALATWQPATHREASQTFYLHSCTQLKSFETP
jgi:hypothetical protein